MMDRLKVAALEIGAEVSAVSASKGFQRKKSLVSGAYSGGFK